MDDERNTEPIPRYQMNWAEFKHHILETKAVRRAGEPIYRGQCNSSWRLQPSLQRLTPPVSHDSYVASIVPEAYRLLGGYLDADLDLAKAAELNRFLGVLQHHGFPTPLLDWTRSPYIAAYFAFSDLTFASPTHDCVTVWMLNATFTVEFFRQHGSVAPYEMVTPHHRCNSRLLAQDGLFTRSLSEQPLDGALAAGMQEHGHPGLLQRFDMPVFEARRALADLALMGLHPGTLFPGIDGACRWLKQAFFMENTYLPSPRVQALLAAVASPHRGGAME